MVAPWSKPEEHAAPNGSEDGHGPVLSPNRASAIEIVGRGPKLDEEFAVRCPSCHTRSFHTETVMASTLAPIKTPHGLE